MSIEFSRCEFSGGKRWIVERELDNRILLKNGFWGINCDPHRFKLYKRKSAALKSLERFGAPLINDGHFECRGRILAVYHGDLITRSGKILKKSDFELSMPEKSRSEFFVNRNEVVR
tara:strand:- start:993 stop:1343 length:351 start_codon:yes stop_codon:yes gene_type:complete